jgi:hypothetical protein
VIIKFSSYQEHSPGTEQNPQTDNSAETLLIRRTLIRFSGAGGSVQRLKKSALFQVMKWEILSSRSLSLRQAGLRNIQGSGIYNKLDKNYCFYKKKNTFATRFGKNINNRKQFICQQFSN